MNLWVVALIVLVILFVVGSFVFIRLAERATDRPIEEASKHERPKDPFYDLIWIAIGNRIEYRGQSFTVIDSANLFCGTRSPHYRHLLLSDDGIGRRLLVSPEYSGDCDVTLWQEEPYDGEMPTRINHPYSLTFNGVEYTFCSSGFNEVAVVGSLDKQEYLTYQCQNGTLLMFERFLHEATLATSEGSIPYEEITVHKR